MTAVKQQKSFSPASESTNQEKQPTGTLADQSTASVNTNNGRAEGRPQAPNDSKHSAQQANLVQIKQQQESDEIKSETSSDELAARSTVPSPSQTPAPPSSVASLSGSANQTTAMRAAATMTSAPIAPAGAPTTASSADSLTTTSTKIQQRQQRFLAAAARSATSPQHSNLTQSPPPSRLCASREAKSHNTTLVPAAETNDVDDIVCDKSSDGTCICGESSECYDQKRPQQQSQQQHQQQAQKRASGCRDRDTDCNCLNGCASFSSKMDRTVKVAPAGAAVVTINCNDIYRGGSAQKFNHTSDDRCGNRQYQQSSQNPLNNNHHHHHHHHHYQQQQQQQPQQHHHHHYHHDHHQKSEVRRSGESKDDTDENTNIKNNTFRNTYHNHHHHHHHQYNNHPHYNYNHFNQNLYQQNSPQFHYQAAQVAMSTAQNQTSQTQQHHVMAHYKFHNDCQSSVLTYEQVKRLDFVMDQVVPIHGRGNAPTLYVRLKELIRLVKHKLQNEHSIEIRDVRLNGGVASYVLAPENSHYNDLDLVFGTDLSNEDQYDVIRDVVLECLMEFYPKEQDSQLRQPSDQPRQPASDLSIIGDTHVNHSSDADALIDDDAQSEQSSRSNRSSSFESDNLNITNNELEDSEDDEGENNDNRVNALGVKSDFHHEENTEDNQSDSQGVASSEASKLVRLNKHCGTKASEANEGNVVGDLNLKAERSRSSPNNVQCRYPQMPPINCAIKEAYVHKMVKVRDDDRWSLISLGVQQSETGNYGQLHRSTAITCNQAGTLLQSRNAEELIKSDEASLCANDPNGSTATAAKGDHCTSRPRQFPNSIELKFVDRMRRKFEFSVDSFQIILDSLIQFYDYAPQSTITIQRKLSTSHPSSTVINTDQLVCRQSCEQCCGPQDRMDVDLATTDHDDGLLQREKLKFMNCRKKHNKHHKSGKNLSSCPGSYYELPLEPNNSLSNSSVASSSGCSSSSSVVSSSSSSLSCDDDQEDLYCDVESSPSSSASTSSLLSSTTVSVLSSTGNECGLTAHQDQSMMSISENAEQRDRCESATSDQAKKQTSKIASDDCNQRELDAVANASDSLRGTICDFETSRLSSNAVISEKFYPTVIGRSEYGNFKEALYHLERKLIATRSPEEIRGGGLLKYCNLLVKNYHPTNAYQIRTLERYMCSRFFIDFSDLNQQRAKLESYLANHFSDDQMQKIDYLTILYNVVQRSTVCLMNHELRLTLNMIRDLAYELNDQQSVQQQQQNHVPQDQSLPPAQVSQSQVPIQQLSIRQSACQPNLQYQQQKPVVLQSGVYRVKLVNYALAKSVKS